MVHSNIHNVANLEGRIGFKKQENRNFVRIFTKDFKISLYTYFLEFKHLLKIHNSKAGTINTAKASS